MPTERQIQQSFIASRASIGGDSGSTGQVALGVNVPIQIFNPRRRCSVKITNLSAVEIFIGFNSTVSQNSGDLLSGVRGAFIVIDTTSPIWGIANAAGASVSYLEFYK